MRLYRRSDSGDAVRDIQGRLLALGYRPQADPGGEFGPATEAAVREFQNDRGLTADGEVGPETWRVLYEAGYRLGDRLLFLRRPMLRGEDVAELQGRLSQLAIDLVDRPGQLAKVANLLGEAGANIVEVYHQRVFTALPAKGALLEVVIETRDRAHLDETVAKLRAAGLEVEVRSNSGGGH